jgi:hypothetical protein
MQVEGLSGTPLFFKEVNHTGGPELAVQLRIFAFEARIAQIDLMLLAFVATLFFFVFRAAAHFRTPLWRPPQTADWLVYGWALFLFFNYRPASTQKVTNHRSRKGRHFA